MPRDHLAGGTMGHTGQGECAGSSGAPQLIRRDRGSEPSCEELEHTQGLESPCISAL